MRKGLLLSSSVLATLPVLLLLEALTDADGAAAEVNAVAVVLLLLVPVLAAWSE